MTTDLERFDELARSIEERFAAQAVEIERLRAALERIAQWSEAYPTKIFPEPDLARAAALLSAGGMSLDVISADNMRYATEGVGRIARAALDAGPSPQLSRPVHAMSDISVSAHVADNKGENGDLRSDLQSGA